MAKWHVKLAIVNFTFQKPCIPIFFAKFYKAIFSEFILLNKNCNKQAVYLSKFFFQLQYFAYENGETYLSIHNSKNNITFYIQKSKNFINY